MRIVKKIVFILAILIVVIAAIGFIFFPSHIHMERSVAIVQKQDVVYSYLNNLKNWNLWSPWYELDTNAKFTLEGPASGVGAIQKWESKVKEVGIGSMKITESVPDSIINVELNFVDNGTAKSYYRLSSIGNVTKVTWGFDVEAGVNPLFRIMGSFMDGMVGKDFEKGLAKLKANAEAITIPFFVADSTSAN